LIRQSIFSQRRAMDTRVKPAYDDFH